MTDFADDTTDTAITLTDIEEVGIGGGAPPPDENPAVVDDVKAAFDEMQKEASKEDPEDAEKEEAEDAEEPDEDEKKPAKDDKKKGEELEEEEEEEDKPKRGRKPLTDEEKEARRNALERDPNARAPERFSEAVKEDWKSVPHTVRAEVHRVLNEVTQSAEQYRPVVERYERIRAYDELAQSNGRDLSDTLNRVVRIEQMMGQNPLAGLELFLEEAGPRKANGAPLTLQDIVSAVNQQGPEFMQQHRSQFEQQRMQAVEQERQAAHRALEEENKALKLQQRLVPLEAEFAKSHPRYYELKPAIAKLFQAGMVGEEFQGLERWAEAYRQADLLHPASKKSASFGETQSDDRVGQDFGGVKSIKSSPGGVSSRIDEDREGDSVHDSVMAAFKELQRKQAKRG